jgi:ABC-type antimicrobial peptide transport system permease subunit
MHTSFVCGIVCTVHGGVTRGCLSGHFGGICDESTSTPSPLIAFLVYKRRVYLRCL